MTVLCIPNQFYAFDFGTPPGDGGDGGGGTGGGEGGEGGEGGGAAHVETEPDTPVIVIPKVHTDEPPRTYMLDPWLAVLL